MVEEPSAQGLTALGIDAKGIIFQIINFLMLLLILRWLAYKPILAVLDKRRQTIADSLKTAQQLEKNKASWLKKEQELRQKTLAQSQKILEEAQNQANQTQKQALEKTQAEQARIIKNTQQQLTQEKTKMMTEAKKDLTRLVAAAAGKVLAKKIDSEEDQKIIQKSLEQIK